MALTNFPDRIQVTLGSFFDGRVPMGGLDENDVIILNRIPATDYWTENGTDIPNSVTNRIRFWPQQAGTIGNAWITGFVGSSAGDWGVTAALGFRFRPGLVVGADYNFKEVWLGSASASYQKATGAGTYSNSATYNIHVFTSMGIADSDSTSLNYFTQSTVQTDNTAVSFIDSSSLVSRIQALGTDTYFDSTNEVTMAYVYYTHQAGRENKKIVHAGPTLTGTVEWTSFAQDGTWEKTKVKVFNHDGATFTFDRSGIGVLEDITKTDSTVFLNT